MINFMDDVLEISSIAIGVLGALTLWGLDRLLRRVKRKQIYRCDICGKFRKKEELTKIEVGNWVIDECFACKEND